MFESSGAFLGFFQSQVVVIVLHPGGSVLLHLVAGVGIDIQRKAGSGMTQQVLHTLDVGSRRNSDSSSGMAKVVRSCIRPSDFSGNFLEGFIKSRDSEVFTCFRTLRPIAARYNG